MRGIMEQFRVNLGDERWWTLGMFKKLRKKRKQRKRPGALREADSGDVRHLGEWAQSRWGVEAYVEPRTAVTQTTVVLVAHDGEWTRRRIDSLEATQEFGKKRSIPVYEVARTGYPQRMRDYTERKKRRPDSV